MYYSLKYITEEVNAFEEIGKSSLYSKKVLNELLDIEGRFVTDVSDK